MNNLTEKDLKDLMKYFDDIAKEKEKALIAYQKRCLRKRKIDSILKDLNI